MIFDLGPMESVEQKMTELRWLHTEQWRNYHDQLMLDRIMSSGQPRSFAEQLNDSFRPYRTRAAEQGVIRANNDTAPTMHARHKFFLSRSCRNHNYYSVFQMSKMDGMKAFKAELMETIRQRSRTNADYWRT